MFNFNTIFKNWFWKTFWPKFKIIVWNFIYINAKLLPLTILSVIVYYLGQKFSGFVFWISLILQTLHFLWLCWKNYKFQVDVFKSTQLIYSSPITLIIGKLGTGKTLYLTYLMKTIKLYVDHIYSNYPVSQNKVKVATFRTIDFRDKTKILPKPSSFIAFDEFYLHIDGTKANKLKEIHDGKTPYIIGARHLDNRIAITAQRAGMVWNDFRELANAVVIPITLKVPRISKTRSPIFPKAFVFQFGIFQSITDYEAWHLEAVKNNAKGEKMKLRNNNFLGINFFKIIIPFDIAISYDSKWLSILREFKNQNVTNKKEHYWSDLKKLSSKEILELVDLDIVLKNLGVW